MKIVAERKEKPEQPDVKMVQESSRTSLVAGGQTKEEARRGRS